VTSVFWFKAGIFAVFGTVLSAIDLKTLRLPHRMTLPLAGLGFLFSFVSGNGLTPLESFLGFTAGIVPLGILAWKRQKTFGFGDAVFAGATGAFFGLMGLGIALVSGGLMALAVVGVRKKEKIFPFGPFLAAGGLTGCLLSFVFRNRSLFHF
jgi:leader peptidase (prepilin peptidase)/N-methyltransferase